MRIVVLFFLLCKSLWAVITLESQLGFEHGPKHIAQMEEMVKAGTAGSMVHNALAIVYEGRGNFENAFRHWALSNEMNRRMKEPSALSTAAHLEQFRTLRGLCTKPQLLQYSLSRRQAESRRVKLNTNISAANKKPKIVPVFVVGMPRSGSTLLERILTGHPRVTSGGENHDFSSSLKTLIQARSP